jgi:general secretion pathway protein A
MYLEFYNFKEKPFSLTPDPAFLYYSYAHKRAIAFLRYGLQESKGFLQLTGPVGSGKTTLLRAVLAQLDERTKTAYIINPCASFPELLRAVMKDLEIPNIPPDTSKMELLDFFHDYLLIQVRRNSPVIIIFDESQNLSLKNLEEIRMLSNFETSKEKLLQIVFVGQSEFNKTVDLPELLQLRQRIQVRYHLSPLRQNEIRGYINHRLQVAGSDGTVKFTEDACAKIFEFSGGIPRLINAVCDVVLLIGYVNENRTFRLCDVQEAINELEGKFDEASPSGVDDTGETSEMPEEDQLYPDTSPSGPISEQIAKPQQMQEEKEQPRVEKEPKPVPSFRPKNGNGLDDDHSAELSHTVIGGFRRIATGSPHRAQGCAEGAEALQEATTEAPETKSVPLHSFLRHQSTRRFRATGSGLLRLEGAGSMRTRLQRFVSKHIMTKNIMVSFGPHVASSPENGKPEAGVNAIAEACGNYVSTEKEHSPVALFPVKPASVSSDTASQSHDSITNGPGARLTGKVIVTFKDGHTLKGTVPELPLEAEGFRIAPMEAGNGQGEHAIAFDEIVVVRFTDTFLEAPARRRRAIQRPPKGHQIVVALRTGELIEGIILNSEPLLNPRFLMMSPYGNKILRTVIEKSGTLGILTRDFREGIYAEEFESFPQENTVSQDDQCPVSPQESRADAFFAASDFASAAVEYQRALKIHPNSQRLMMKASVSYLNLGVHYLRTNQLASACRALEKVTTGPNFRTRAFALIRNIEVLLSRNGEAERVDEGIPEGMD